MSDSHAGSCFCGEVKFQVTGQPNAMGYCHCTDCAHWAGAPINAFSLWSPQSVQVLAGAERIGTYAKTPGSQRKFCTACGGHVFTDHPQMGLVDVYLNTVPSFKHQGALHVFYSEKTLSVKDGLPKYRDMPKEFGGSGATLPE